MSDGEIVVCVRCGGFAQTLPANPGFEPQYIALDKDGLNREIKQLKRERDEARRQLIRVAEIMLDQGEYAAESAHLADSCIIQAGHLKDDAYKLRAALDEAIEDRNRQFERFARLRAAIRDALIEAAAADGLREMSKESECPLLALRQKKGPK